MGFHDKNEIEAEGNSLVFGFSRPTICLDFQFSSVQFIQFQNSANIQFNSKLTTTNINNI